MKPQKSGWEGDFEVLIGAGLVHRFRVCSCLFLGVSLDVCVWIGCCPLSVKTRKHKSEFPKYVWSCIPFSRKRFGRSVSGLIPSLALMSGVHDKRSNFIRASDHELLRNVCGRSVQSSTVAANNAHEEDG